MLDGLRREFPEVATYARRVPSPRVARAPTLWSVLAGFGAGFFVSGVVLILLSLLFRSTTRETPLPAPFELARAASTGAALAVAWIAGGRAAIAGYAGIEILERLLGIPNQLRFCATLASDPNIAAGGVCSLGNYVIAFWPQVLGVALAFAIARWLRAASGDRNPTLEAAGAFALRQGLGGSIVGATFGSASPDSPGALLLVVFVPIAAGIALGYVILRRASRRWRTLGIVALMLAAEFVVLALPTLTSQLALTRGVSLLGPVQLLSYVASFFAIGAAALVLYMAATRRATAA